MISFMGVFPVYKPLTDGDRESAVLRTFLNCLTQALIGKISNSNFLNDQNITSRVQEKYGVQDL